MNYIINSWIYASRH